MQRRIYILILHLLIPSGLLLCSLSLNAQGKTQPTFDWGPFIFLIILLSIILLAAIVMSATTKELLNKNRKRKILKSEEQFTEYLKNLKSDQIEIVLKKKKARNSKGSVNASKFRMKQ